MPFRGFDVGKVSRPPECLLKVFRHKKMGRPSLTSRDILPLGMARPVASLVSPSSGHVDNVRSTFRLLLWRKTITFSLEFTSCRILHTADRTLVAFVWGT